MVVATPDRSRAFTANIKSGSMSALDLKTGKSLGDVKTGAGAEGIDISPDGKQVWVTNREADTVTVVDAQSLQVIGSIASAKFPIRAKVTPDGKRALVSNAMSGDMSVITTADRKVEQTLKFSLDGKDGGPIVGVLIDPEGKRAYVAHVQTSQISIVDLSSWKQVGTITVGKGPDGMAYSKLPMQAAASGR